VPGAGRGGVPVQGEMGLSGVREGVGNRELGIGRGF